MRLVTMNIWGTRGDWPARRAVLAAGLADLDPDLLVLQETIVTDGYDQVRDLVGPDYRIVHQSAREPDGQGVSIAGRWPLTDVRELDLQVSDRTPGFACTTLIARTETPCGPLVLANHFPSWQLQLEAERQAQAVLAARAVEELVGLSGQGCHAVVAGDLDAAPEATSVRFWTGHAALDGFSVCYRDAWAAARPGEPGDTYTPENELMADADWPFRRIDYVLVRCGVHGGPTLAVRDCRRIFDRPVDGVWASDHFGLVADLASP